MQDAPFPVSVPVAPCETEIRAENVRTAVPEKTKGGHPAYRPAQKRNRQETDTPDLTRPGKRPAGSPKEKLNRRPDKKMEVPQKKTSFPSGPPCLSSRSTGKREKGITTAYKPS